MGHRGGLKMPMTTIAVLLIVSSAGIVFLVSFFVALCRDGKGRGKYQVVRLEPDGAVEYGFEIADPGPPPVTPGMSNRRPGRLKLLRFD